jgi:hypothetical protein
MRSEPCILFLAANPEGTDHLALDAEARDIQMKLDATPARGVQAVTRWAVTPDDLLHHLNTIQPVVVHFSGHGAGSPGLVLHDESAGAVPVSASALRRLFSALRDNIRLVVLNACFSSVQAEAIAEVIDVVVGMNDTIGDEAARRFAASFYRALGHARSARNAFDQGVAAIALHGLRDETVPRLVARRGIDPGAVFPLAAHGEAQDLIGPNDQARRGGPVEDHPGAWFLSEFREIVRPVRDPSANAVVNLVFGDLSRARNLVPVIPINQSFDFEQRGPRSVLAAFENVDVKGVAFYTALEQLWPAHTRPRAAGLGSTHYIPLPANSMDFPGIMFAVTTRDLSRRPADYGYYVNTPLEGIDLVLQAVLDRASRESILGLAIPLLGAGYANIRNGIDQALLNAAVLGLTIIKLGDHLGSPDCPLRRVVVVAYSNDPQSKAEHALWDFAVPLLAMDAGERATWFRSWCVNRGW